jgi:hypothetical protein
MRRNVPSPQREINDLEPPACFYYALKSVNLTVPDGCPLRALQSRSCTTLRMTAVCRKQKLIWEF